jgi:phage terminase large subunit GpA-like protein
VLSPESCAEPGRYYVERFEPQRGIQDAFSNPAVEQVVVMSSSQIGKTTIIENIIGYYIDQLPSPILWIEPTLELSKAMSKDRLDPMMRDTPCLRGKIQDAKSKDADNTILHKRFLGGHITLAGANSPASLAGRPVRVVLCDEVDRYPFSAGAEGDPVDLAFKRATTFWNRKLGMFSTPTVKGQSRIEAAYNMSNKGKYYVPCPKCGHYQVLRWTQVKWPEGNPLDAYYECESCKNEIHDTDKIRMLRKGEWRAEGENHAIAGFWINELYSPWVTLGNMALRFLEAKKRGPEALQVFINTSLAETWQEIMGSSKETGPFMARREGYEQPPLSSAIITAGVDIQDDRIECEVKAWGIGRESFGLTHKIFYGKPHLLQNADSLPEVWQRLDEFLSASWTHECGAILPIHCTCIDMGYLTNEVLKFCKSRRSRNIFPTKGMSDSKRELVGRASKNNRYKLPFFPIGPNAAKDIIFSNIDLTDTVGIGEGGPGVMHWNKNFDEAYFVQLLQSEKPKYIKGARVYEKVSDGVRNEGLDLNVLNLVAFELLRVNPESRVKEYKERFDRERKIQQVETKREESDEDDNPRQRPLRRRSWVKGWKQ